VHELSLTQNFIEIAESHARKAGGTIIRGITLEVGELCGAIPEALEFAFDVCSKGTLVLLTSAARGRWPKEQS